MQLRYVSELLDAYRDSNMDMIRDIFLSVDADAILKIKHEAWSREYFSLVAKTNWYLYCSICLYLGFY
jgi:hypothetical protein